MNWAVRIASPIVLLLALAACSPSYSPDTYASTAVQQASKVEQGVVVGVRQVAVTASGAVGAATGAAAGGIVGAQVPGSSMQTALSALGGSVVGGLVGTGIERATGDTTAFEYVVRKPNGELVSVTQKDAAPLALGRKVLVIAGPQARIVPDYTVPPDLAPAANPVPVPPKPAEPPQATPQATPLNPSAAPAPAAPAARPDETST